MTVAEMIAQRTAKQNMTVHRWFANKSCPGDYLYNLHPQIAAEVNKRLSGEEEKEENEMRYNTVADLKADKHNGEHYLPTVEKLLKNGILRGKGGSGDETVIDLGEDAVRVLVTLDRAGLYGE